MPLSSSPPTASCSVSSSADRRCGSRILGRSPNSPTKGSASSPRASSSGPYSPPIPMPPRPRRGSPASPSASAASAASTRSRAMTCWSRRWRYSAMTLFLHPSPSPLPATASSAPPLPRRPSASASRSTSPALCRRLASSPASTFTYSPPDPKACASRRTKRWRPAFRSSRRRSANCRTASRKRLACSSRRVTRRPSRTPFARCWPDPTPSLRWAKRQGPASSTASDPRPSNSARTGGRRPPPRYRRPLTSRLRSISQPRPLRSTRLTSISVTSPQALSVCRPSA